MESPKISLAEQQLASVSNNPASYDSGKVRNNCQPSDAASKLGLSKQPVMPRREHLHQDVADGLDLRIDQHGKAVVAMHNAGNPYALYVGTHSLNVLLREVAVQAGLKPRNGDIAEFSNYLQSRAESVNRVTHVSYRVASSDAGIVLDLGDAKHTRVSITAGKVEVITSGSETLFYRPSTSRPMAMPAEVGNLALLDKYLNLQPESKMLIKAWLSYTLATPKLPTSNYVILVLSGTQGSGKTSLSKNVILGLIDPSAVGVQMFPSNKQDFAIAAQNAHVLCYDNLREFKHSMADLLCVASTGGSISTRQLYTNADQQVHTLHVALVLNGIHSSSISPTCRNAP